VYELRSRITVPKVMLQNRIIAPIFSVGGAATVFVLPTESWWTNYYGPILAKLPSLKEKIQEE